MFRDLVTSEEALRALVGRPSELALKKQIAALDPHCRDFIARAPFVLVATANAAGQCDVSPKGDAPGFVRVLDERHLAIPDRPGNKRLDGMRNILQNPHVGVIFLIPERPLRTYRGIARGVMPRGLREKKDAARPSRRSTNPSRWRRPTFPWSTASRWPARSSTRPPGGSGRRW